MADEHENSGAFDRLEAQARIGKTRMTDTLTDEQRHEIIERAKRFCAETRTTQAALGRMAGYGATSVCQVLKGKYRANGNEILTAIEAVLEQESSRWVSDRPFVETRVAKRINTIANTAINSQRICVVCGPSGIGKSMALRAVARKHPNSVLLEINDKSSTPVHLYRELALIVTLNSHGVGRASLFALLVKELKGSKRLLMFDEAENLSMTALNAIRQLHDATGCPVLLCGRPPLKELIDATTRDKRIGGGLKGRILTSPTIRAPQPAGGGRGPVEPLFSVDEVLAMFARSEVRIAPDAGRWLCAVANLITLGDGREGCGLRYAVSLFDLAVQCSEDEDAQGRTLVTLETLKAVNAELLDGDYVAAIEAEIAPWIERLRKLA